MDRNDHSMIMYQDDYSSITSDFDSHGIQVMDENEKVRLIEE